MRRCYTTVPEALSTESLINMVAPEGNKLPTQEFKRMEQLRKLRRELAAVVRDNEVDKLLELNDRSIADYLVRAIMSLSKVIDDRNELER